MTGRTSSAGLTRMASEVSPLLRELWRRRAAVLATNVAVAVREHREIAHAATLIGEDYHDRFLVELIQNANDQAVLAGVHDSTVVVVRSERFVAVSNGGEVVTTRNLERISSLADSDKTGVLVGNKGVGFKAVYQVTDAPEVYSAPAGSDQSVFEELSIGFALERMPFNDPALRSAVEQDVRQFFHANAGLAAYLNEAGFEDPVEAVQPELSKVAGFKFPLPRGADDLEQRAGALGVPRPLRGGVRTLVVLPLRDETASTTAEKTIDHLVEGTSGTAQAELAVLFLRGIGRIVVIDQVRGRRWEFAGRVTHPEADVLQHATVEVVRDEGPLVASGYWLVRGDVFDCAEEEEPARRSLVDAALKQFGLEAWKPEDPLPVTVALPKRAGADQTSAAGRFCLGLPTEQSTGLPAHVDARFFAKINRDGVNFDQKEGYNGLLLEVATELFGTLVRRLQESEIIQERRAATLALHRVPGEPGALADGVYAEGGLADNPVVLAWGGDVFLPRSDCRLPSAEERDLLPFVDGVLAMSPDGAAGLPERGLLDSALDELATMDLAPLEDIVPHPWLRRGQDGLSVVEASAILHRPDGPEWWTPFVDALLAGFQDYELADQRWLPTGGSELSPPDERVFLPASTTPGEDDDEVSDVPPNVAATLRLLDGTALQVREDGRTLTPLAASLAERKMVRRPRKTELLEDALFPALKTAAREDLDLALALFIQAVWWIGSMKDASRRKLDCRNALVPVGEVGEARWVHPTQAYMGAGWGLEEDHEALLAAAYRTRLLAPWPELAERLPGPMEAAQARLAASTLGVAEHPRVEVIPRGKDWPLRSSHLKLTVKGAPALGRPELDTLYREYLEFVASFGTVWDWPFDHDVKEVSWVEGLEDEERRVAVLDLMLMRPELYVPHTTTELRRVGHNAIRTVPQLWCFALESQGWRVFPVERGAGGERVREPASSAWLLSDGSRRTAFAKLVFVIPHGLTGAWKLLERLGVWTLETAPGRRLVTELVALAERLERDHLEGHRDALSLARELYSQIEERAAVGEIELPPGRPVPLLRRGKLTAVVPGAEDTVVLFDDDPARSRHVPAAQGALRVPVGRDAKIDELVGVFVGAWGESRVVRASTAKVDTGFTPAPGEPEPFLGWLQRAFPRSEVAVDLAALLTFGGDRTFRSERLGRNWRLFRRLRIQFGSFRSTDLGSFYDRPQDLLFVSTSMDEAGVVAATWELAGVRSRDLWEGYARALREEGDGPAGPRAFLRERQITQVEIVDVADAAGLHSSHNVDGLECALLAVHRHLLGGDLDDAARWWAAAERNPKAIAASLDRPDLAEVVERAVTLQPPEGELLLLRHVGAPWSGWQAAVERRDGRKYRFESSVSRFRSVWKHLDAVVRELAVRGSGADLEKVGAALTEQAEVPEEVACLPLDAASADHRALERMVGRMEGHGALLSGLASLPSPPWTGDLPLPEARRATQRGIALYRDQPVANREVEASSTVAAVVEVAGRLAQVLGESIDPSSVATEGDVALLSRGAWANVYAALSALRESLIELAPETTRRLTSARAFHGPSQIEPLLARIPELSQPEPPKPPPRKEVLGLELTDQGLQKDLAAGSAGTLGAMLAEAAAAGLDPALLRSGRSPLPEPKKREGGGGGGPPRRRGGGGKPLREPELIGDLGEAFVHEWLALTLGEGYDPACWRSKARERYGLPPCGDDGLGYDFEVSDSTGTLFGVQNSRLLIEVKSTSTDGSRPFPMSRGEWDMARRCHEEQNGALYVILRVIHADTAPRIGDVIRDPFAAHRRGEVRWIERDLWVTVAPLESPGDQADAGKGGGA